jgi:osmotically inducible protein OsmC
VLKQKPYSFSTRFENGVGTNPEELIAAAHAGFFTMALSAFLGAEGFKPDELSTQAKLTLDQVDGNWTITRFTLILRARFPALTSHGLEYQAVAASNNRRLKPATQPFAATK